MSFLDGVRHRISVVVRGEAYAREVERELRFHADLAGLAANDVETEIAARRTVGNVTYYREEVRRMTLQTWVDRMRQDARYAWRGLLRTPAFTATVVATLGLGIGVNATMYSFLERLYVRPPAGIVAPNGVKRLYIQSPRIQTRSGSGVFGAWSYPHFSAVRDRIGDTIRVAAYSPSEGTVQRVGETWDSVRTSFVSGDYFRVLALRPAIGRFFAPEEARVENPAPVAVISDALWERTFARDSAVLGRVIELKTMRATVIGVAPRAFAGVELNRVDVWLPLSVFPVAPRNGFQWYEGTGNYLRAMARAETGEEISRLRNVGTAAIRANKADARPDTLASLVTGPIVERRGPADTEPAVSVAARIGVVAFIVLVVACANVANMLLLRAVTRSRELAVRRALGVSTARLYAQLTTESVLLGVSSGIVALVFAFWASAALRALILPTMHWSAPPLDGAVVAVTLGAAFVAGFLAGLVPAALATRLDLAQTLKAGARKRPTRPRTQSALLIAQAALSVVLVVGAGLFVRSFSNVRAIDLGYEPEGMLVAGTYIRDAARERVVGNGFVVIAERVRNAPGVSAVGLASSTPMAGYGVMRLYRPGSDSALRAPIGGYPSFNAVGPDFFAASGVRVLAGRDFTPNDRAGSAPVIILSRQLAEGIWPGQSPLGQCVAVGQPTSGCSTVVGIVEDVHRMSLIEGIGTQFYLPLAQRPDGPPSTIVVRARASAVANVNMLMRTELAALMPDQAEWALRPMNSILENEMRPWRMGAILFAGLGALALLVAGIGIYGVVAYATSQRTHEMGVRIALGARHSDILDLVVADGLRVVTIGIAIGLVIALLSGRLVASQLFGVTPNDPSVLIMAVVTMGALAGVASLVPGWRAARSDPMQALRAE